MTLKIIGAGFGRTGTASLKMALEKLGIGRCYHMSEVLANPAHIDFWVDVANGRPDFDRIFADFAATVDFPACIYWRELLAHFGDAKVILSTRDASAWYESTQETILGPKWWDFTMQGPFGAMVKATIGQYFDGKVHDREHMLQRFHAHMAAVEAAVPPERLLVFEARQGWQPICAFLDLPVPSERYPHANSEDETKALLDGIMASVAADSIGAEAIEEPNEAFSGRRP
jgi:hypothetical protein